MTGHRSADYLASLLHELCALPRETEWVEFKEDNADPKEIGEYISALANAAALVGKAFAYLVWGVRDSDHAVVGTRFDPHATRVGNEELESWLLRLLEPKIDFRFFTVEVGGQARGAAGNRTRGPPSGALLGPGVHPGRNLQEEAQGLPREGAGALAHL